MAATMARSLLKCSRVLINRSCCCKSMIGLTERPLPKPQLINICSSVRALHLSRPHNDLKEFFDEKDNMKEEKVAVGRPWKSDELRLKSNQDLHKLWYVLLKERNMIMTMEHEYNRLQEAMPSPERLEKVEESMENLLEVVAERDRAYNILETGETGEPGRTYLIDRLGRGYMRKHKEYHMPLESNTAVLRSYKAKRKHWQVKYLKLDREQRMEKTSRNTKKLQKYRAGLNKLLNVDRNEIPDEDIETRNMPIKEKDLI